MKTRCCGLRSPPPPSTRPASYDVNAIDPDATDTLTYLLTTVPIGMTINATTVVIGWTFTKAQASAKAVTVRVQDVASATVTQDFPVP